MPKLLTSMDQGITRLKEISLSLRTFARSDTSSKVEYQIHEGIDSTLMLLKYRLKGNHNSPEIQVIKKYGELPPIICYPGQMNQVFMNIIANAIDAFSEFHQDKSHENVAINKNTITITTSVEPQQKNVRICIQDNGSGMSSEVQARMFEPSFTTKPVGKGTGLGLAITYQIITNNHHGQINCFSTPNHGTMFIINLPI